MQGVQWRWVLLGLVVVPVLASLLEEDEGSHRLLKMDAKDFNPWVWEEMGITIPDATRLHTTFSARQESTAAFGIIPLERATGDTRYNFKIFVGSPNRQAISIVVDSTASALMLFNATDCTLRWNCFDSSLSRTFRYCSGPATNECPRKTYCRMATDFVSFGSNTSRLSSSNFPICISSYAYGWKYHPLVGGFLGLGLNAGGMPSFASIFPPGWPRLIALDLNMQGPSAMILGGYNDSAPVERLEWSERQIQVNPYHWFPVYKISMCGEDLLSSTMMALVNTDSPCLVLPAVLFNKVMTWAGAACDWSHNCRPNAGQNESTIPDLQFKISQDGKMLRISMADLLFFPSSNSENKIYCISRAEDERSVRLLNHPIIGLGSFVFNSLLVVLDADNYRVGLANKRPPKQAPEVCPEKTVCSDDQTYSGATNTCTDPPCNSYWFQRYDKVTKECVVMMELRVSVLCIVLVFGAIDIFLNEVRRRFYNRVLPNPRINVLPPAKGQSTSIASS